MTPQVTYSLGAKIGGGGVGRTAWHAARALHRHGMLARVVCGALAPGALPPERVRALGLASRVLRKLAAVSGAAWLEQLHRQLYDCWATRHLGTPDLFHGWNGHCLRCLGRARASGAFTVVERASCHPRYQARVLEEEHRRWALPWRPPGSTLPRALAELELADRVLVPSPFARRSFETEGFKGERLLEIPFGVDVHHFRPRERRDAGPFRVLFVGQCGLRKGLLDLLQAWRRLGWHDAELWIAGRPDRHVLALLRPWRRWPGVRWWGFVADPAPLYQAADAFAFPTLEEGSALAVYEALACGLPVVTTAHAGSVVRDGREGYLFPIRDPEGLAECLEALRSSPESRRELARAARRRAEQFTWERYGDALVASLCAAYAAR